MQQPDNRNRDIEGKIMKKSVSTRTRLPVRDFVSGALRSLARDRAPKMLLPALLVLAFGGALANTAFAVAPSAGTEISNTASATYVPAGYTQQEQIESNTVTAVVETVEALSLTTDQTISRTPGATARFSHLLENTGNVASTYRFSITPSGAGCPAGDFDLTGVKLYRDNNSNGVIDSGDTELPLDADSALQLQPGDIAALLVEGLVPGTASAGQSCYTLTATTALDGISATNVDITDVRNAAVLSLIKSASYPGAVLPGTTIVDFKVNTTNIGNQDAAPSAATSDGTPILVDGSPRQLILVRDLVPQGTQYVAGSLKTATPGALRLFRLPGDPAFAYRTGGDDAAAIEVAIGLTQPLVRNGSVAMSFSAKVLADAEGYIINIADSRFDDGTAPAEARSNRAIIATTPASIGIAKSAGQAMAGINANGEPDGTVTVPFKLRVRNYGSDALYNVQINDLLEGGGATQFGAYTAAAAPGSGEYTIVAGSLKIEDLQGAISQASVNTAFTGASGHDNLLAPDATLSANGELTVSFAVRVNVSGRSGTLYNQASAQAAIVATGPAIISDQSVNGNNPDPDGDGNPGNNSSATPISVAQPAIALSKSVTPPHRIAEGQYEFDYILKVTNTGSVTAPNVRLIDNLDCTFRTDDPAGSVESWQLVGAPVSSSGRLVPASTFTGHAFCNRDKLANPNPVQSLPTEVALSLTDGSKSLAPGESDTFTIRIRAKLKPSAIGTPVHIDNRAWAASLDRNSVNVMPGAVIAAAASAHADMLLIDPQGVVYNSVTRVPVPGAPVRLVRDSCAGGAAGPITPGELYYGDISGLYTFNADGSVSMSTTASGEYQFFLRSPPAGDRCTYHLEVTPPAGSGLAGPSTLIPVEQSTFTSCGAVVPNSGAPRGSDPTTHYFRFDAGLNGPDGGICQVVHNHIPLDPENLNGLMLKKEGDKSQAELGDFVHYTLTLTNKTGTALTSLHFEDQLPLGFAYVPGSTIVDGVKRADPAGAPGRNLTFDYPDFPIANNATATISYRLRIGVGAPTSGDAVNRAKVYSGPLKSNEAAWKVTISGGVFSDEAFIFGKVFLDCNRNRRQDDDEVGVPGVRLFLEDGTGVITDAEGKWSLYGIRPITHALKLDKATLPAGAELELLDNRQSADAGTRFVDLRNGELRRADFAIDGCAASDVVADVKARRQYLLAQPGAEGEVARAQVRLTPDGKPIQIGDARALAASGKVDEHGTVQLDTPAQRPLIEAPGLAGSSAGGSVPPMPVSVRAKPVTSENGPAFDSVRPADVKVAPIGSMPDGDERIAAGSVGIEAQLADLNNEAGFVGLNDGDTLASQQINVIVKGPADAKLRLSVNGEVVPERRVGKKASLAARNITAWEYIGVMLKPGSNTLLLESVDAFGVVRTSRSLSVVAPDKLGRIEVNAPQTARIGSPVALTFRLTDERGVPVTARTAVTLEASNGRWEAPDLNPEEPGLQTFIQGGQATFELVPPEAPGNVLVRVSAGALQRDTRIAFLDELKPLTGVGIVEARVDLNKHVEGLGSRTAFEGELDGVSRDFADGKGGVSGRAAFYFKGVIKGEYLLTASYDTDKTSRDRLFRDIRPDEYYPVYGDASTRTFDAQSTDKAYVRIDNGRSFLLYGDLTTAASPEVRQLSQVNRSLTGVKQHIETDKVRVEAYASRDRLKQKIEEFPANGTSGPYFLKAPGDLYRNSERVEILVRDRNQPNVILSVTPLARFSDYAIEPLSKRLLFNRPIASFDADLNPQSIRVTYEVDEGGSAFWVAGADVQVKVGKNVQLGIAAAIDNDPENSRKLIAATGIARLGDKTTLSGEVVGTRSDEKGDGYAARVELRHEDKKLKVHAQATKVSKDFDNPSSAVASGRTEANIRIEYDLNDLTSLRGEAIYSDGGAGENMRRGAIVSVRRKIGKDIVAEVGARFGRETASPAGSFDYGTVSSPTSSSRYANGTSDTDTISLRGRLTARLPFAPQARVFVEGEQALDHADRGLLAVGGDYQLSDKTSLFGRYELISSLTGPFGLNGMQENNSAVFGIQSTYMKNGRAYSEYRLRDSIDGRSAQAAIGLRNTISISKGLNLQAGLERTEALGGAPGVQSTAITTGLDYTALNWLKASGTLELRFGDDSDSLLSTLGVAAKLDPDWTLLARSIVSDTNAKDSAGTDHLLMRQQIGFAYRPVDGYDWNALARYEHKFERLGGNSDETTVTHIFSGHVNVEPEPWLQINGRYAFKYSIFDADGLRSTYWAHLLSGRVTYDINERWDIGAQSTFLFGKGGARQWALGAEVGYRLLPNLWLSSGYNFLGLRDRDLTGSDYLDRGFYIRLRFKFDEGIFGQQDANREAGK